MEMSDKSDAHVLDLVKAIHSSALATQPWQEALLALRRHLGAHFADIIFRRSGAPPEELTEYHSSNSYPEGLRELYFQTFHADDPFPYFSMKPARTYRLLELLGTAERHDHRFYRDYLVTCGVGDLVQFMIAEPGGCRAWVTLLRPAGALPFDEADIETCNLAAEHFSIALRAFAAVEARRIEGAILQQMLLCLNFGCLTLDATMRIRSRDALAAAVLVESDAVAVDPEGRLRLADPRATATLRSLVAAAAAGHGGRRALRLGGTPVVDILVEPLAVEGEARAGAPIAVIYVRGKPADGDGAKDPERSARLRELFDLTPSEARLTVSLAHGRSLIEAAGTLGISEQTARTYTKRIFSKTRTSRQAELVHKVLTSLASLV